ncbi:cyclic pyranopterin monophosphate synthase MoaC [Verrucomicrobia bacterium LW23]|nr:cyclic pyranopterin monophosphate synthase MoaC [Verrucomicrobia bacterium LW23]
MQARLADVSTPFSHLDETGGARMVSVAHKADVARRAEASGFVSMGAATVDALRRHALPKGDVLTVAKIAGIQAAKLTSQIIPLCHPLPLHHVDVTFAVRDDGVAITATASTVGKTGVEMEALTAVSGAALTLFDMCKAVDKSMRISDIAVTLKEKDSVVTLGVSQSTPAPASATAPAAS